MRVLCGRILPAGLFAMLLVCAAPCRAAEGDEIECPNSRPPPSNRHSLKVKINVMLYRH